MLLRLCLLGMLVLFKARSSVQYNTRLCPTFETVNKNEDSVWCETKCVSNKNSPIVRGTLSYSKGSPVCFAARHAGFLSEKGGLVRFSFYNYSRTAIASEQNGIRSIATDKGRYYFISISDDKAINEWMSDVVMVHNSFCEKNLKMSCIFDSPTLKLPREFFRYNYGVIRDGVRRNNNEPVIKYTTPDNKRAFVCKGRNENYDVLGTLSCPTKDTCNISNTHIGYEGEQRLLPYTCDIKTRNNPYWDRIGDKADPRSLENKVAILFNFTKESEGIYAIGKTRRDNHNKMNSKSAHFQIIVKECQDKAHCEEKQASTQCKNGGVIHDRTKMCICPPGFNGTKCEKLCDLSYFGSRCHLSCLPNYYGDFFGPKRTNCKGLTFCLPKPYGCSCYHGFAGNACNQITDLVKPLPYFKYVPKVSIANSTASLSVEPWRPDTDGGYDYGMQIEGYEFIITTQSNSKKVISTYSTSSSFEINEEGEHDVKVRIKLKDFEKTGRENFMENIHIPSLTFYSPCKRGLSNKDVILTHLESEKVLVEVPLIEEPTNKEISCTLSYHFNSITKRPNKKDTKLAFQAEISPGETTTADIWCQNEFGSCHAISFSLWGDFKLSDYVVQDNSLFWVNELPILNRYSTIFQLYKVDKGSKKLIESQFKTQRTFDLASISSSNEMVVKFQLLFKFILNGREKNKTHILTYDFCPKFEEIETTQHFCKSICLKPRNLEIYGTDIYSKDSFVCLSALHAGAIDDNGCATVTFQSRGTSTFKGTIRNRVNSLSKRKNEGFEFIFSKSNLSSLLGKWPTDVYLLHYTLNEYKDVKVACMPDSQSLGGIFSWTQEKLQTNTTAGGIATHLGNKNKRVFICRGQHPISDITGVFQRLNDLPKVNVTQVGIVGKPLKLKNISDSRGLYRKLPNPWKFPQLPEKLEFSSLETGDEGVYIFKNQEKELNEKIEKEINLNGAYFHLFVRECDKDKYGVNCEHECPKCLYNGVCHPLTGSCICRPGFSGSNCETICPLNHFGSGCHLDCSNYYLRAFFNSGTTCKGILFCLPRPYGCGCAHGYGGHLCQDEEPLVKPFAQLKDPPYMFVDSEMTPKITFRAWDPQKDIGYDYGSELDYKVEYRKINDKMHSQSLTPTKKGNNFTVDLPIQDPSKTPLQVSVIIDLKNYSRSKKEWNPPEMVLSFPCLDVKKQRIKTTKAETSALEIEIPLPKLKAKHRIQCSLETVTMASNTGERNIKRCPDAQISNDNYNFTCLLDELPSGEEFLLEFKCQNEFGHCQIRGRATTHPNFDELITFDEENSRLHLAGFHLLNQSDSTFSLFSLANTEENLHKLEIFKETQTHENENIIRVEKVFDIKPLMRMTAANISESLSLKEQEGKIILATLEYKANGKDYLKVFQASTRPIAIAWGYLAILLLLPLLVLLIYKRKPLKSLYIRANSHQNNTRKSSSQAPCVDNAETIQQKSTLDGKTQIEDEYQDFDQSSTQILYPAQLTTNTKESSIFYCPSIAMYEPVKRNSTSENGNSIDEDLKKLDDKIDDEDIYIDVESLDLLLTVERYLVKSIDSYLVAEEFKAIPVYDTSKRLDYAKDPNNKPKNRYINNLPYDETRVVLMRLRNDPYTDYINANFVENPFDKRKIYIAAQGPKDANMSTIADFWRMVIENDVEVIVMVANFVEKEKRKVGEYFNREETLNLRYGMKVEVINISYEAHFILSLIQVRHRNGFKNVKHFQYIKWPDHGVPSEPQSLSVMMRAIMQDFIKGGIVVHCSAGIGRTGTVLLVLFAIEMQKQNKFDPMGIVHHLRKCRARLVENSAQYNFGLKVLYEMFFGGKGTVTLEDLQQVCHPNSVNEQPLDIIMKRDSTLYSRILALSFPHSYEIARNQMNCHLNRSPHILPPDLVRVFIEPPDNIPPYINAIEMKLEAVDPLVVTVEHPLPQSLKSFWWMILEKGSDSLILINEIKPSENFPSLIPSDKVPFEIGDFIVKITSSEQFNSHIKKNQIVIQYHDQVLPVNVLEVSEWLMKEECPSDPSIIASLVDIVLGSVRNSVILCCGDGVTGCGLVAASLLMIANFNLKNEFNIYKTVIEMKKQRLHFIQSQKQFDFLYIVADFYFKNYAQYSDVK